MGIMRRRILSTAQVEGSLGELSIIYQLVSTSINILRGGT